MKRIFSKLLLTTFCFSFSFTSLTYAGGGQEITEGYEPVFSLGGSSSSIDPLAVQNEIEQEKEISPPPMQHIEIGNALVQREDLSSGMNEHIFPLLPKKILDLILWYVSGDRKALSYWRVSKDFHTLLQGHDQHYVNKYLLADLPLSERLGKTPAELYRLHRARVKSSVADFWEMPSTLENVYSSPYLEEEEYFSSCLINLLCGQNRKIRRFMIAKGNTNAMQSQYSNAYTGQESEREIMQNKEEKFISIQEIEAELIKRKNLEDPLLQESFTILQDNIKAGHEFIEFYANKGFPSFLELKLRGLMEGAYGYERNSAAAIQFLEELIEKGDQDVKEYKIDHLSNASIDTRVYPFDLALARQVNEAWIAQGDKEALGRKIIGLGLGDYGYDQDLPAALELIQQEKGKGDKHAAMWHEINIYLELVKQGKSQLQNNQDSLELTQQIERYSHEIHSLIDQLIYEKDIEAFNFKLEGLKTGQYGYTQVDRNSLCSLIEEAAKVYHPGAIGYKLAGLYLGEEGYTQDLPALSQYISSLHEQGFREASYLKALSLKFGVFGFQEDAEDARKFILQHRIAF